MGYTVTWTRTTTHRAEIDLTPEELAAWVTTAAAGTILAPTAAAIAGTSIDQLGQLIRRNVHLRDRLLEFYIEQQNPANTQISAATTLVSTGEAGTQPL